MSLETVPIEVINILRENALQNKHLAILAGAGISRQAPSNLPTAGEMMICVLREILTPDIFLRSKDLLNSERQNRRSPKDFIRFELLVQMLAKYSGDTNLTFLNYLSKCYSPNKNHFVLAELLRTGHQVFTTNFDSLIEIACAHKKVQPIVLADDNDFRNWSQNYTNPNLYKLHGTFEHNGRESRTTLRATLDSIVRTGNTDIMLEQSKFNVLSKIAASHDLLVIGYSGADDFDILPTLQMIRALGRKIIWINHTPSSTYNLFRYRDLDRYPCDTNGFVLAERVRLLNALVSEGNRSKDDIFLVDCDTNEIIKLLEEIYRVPSVPRDEQSYEINLEQFCRQWFERHLPQPTDRLYIGSQILFERERYEDALSLLDQVIADSAGNADLLVKASLAKVNYFLRNSDFIAARKPLDGIGEAVKSQKDSGVKGMYWHQLGHIQFNLGEHAFFNYQFQGSREELNKALSSYQEALKVWKNTRESQGMSATLHQMGQLFIRFSEPERLQTIYKAKIEKSRFDKKVGVGQQSVIDIIKQAFHSLLTSFWLSIHSLRRKWYLYKATQCFKKAMKIAKIDGQWERYCESASGIAVAMHINQQYRLEVKVLADAAKHASILGSAYLTGSIWGQMGLALIFCNEYWRAHASLILAQRITKEGGEAQREEIQTALDMLIQRVGDSILFSIESVTLESLQDWELNNIILEGK